MIIPGKVRGDRKSLRRALLISLAVSVALSAALSTVFGRSAFGLFFLLPLGVLISRSRKTQVESPNTTNSPLDNKPIVPR
jgi:hypothetical protein